ncbi:lipoprotein-releasing ABC transporter permease subunit [Stappia sp. GBMRC 2046]|uniref:Lipoprotein-releasing ABC transporter permease subunit n=2 Tax=Stappia sediminis TaxID=2692190 RepID=A0A7X3LXU8_9HYPH|nr:lipoprotein-releasing ABC transporter permease subunit [Stappia sediminis]MXN67026.1 lipoprotein-releasing ABC transporter permease subunit [Stappia sediminis]
MTAEAADENLEGTRPFARFEWMLAGRYLRSRRRETFISIIAGFSFIGIMLGVATLIIVMAVMNGFRGELLSKILGVNGHMLVQPIDSALDDYDAVAARIDNLDGVRFAMPFVEGQALVSGPVGALGGLVRGVREVDLRRVPLVTKTIRAGAFDDFDTSGGVAIGTRMAQQLGVAVGDRVTIVSPRGNITPLGTTPRVKGYPVVAIFEIGMSEYDSTFVFMPFEEAQLYFNQEEAATGIEVFVDDPDNVGPMRRAVEDGAGRPAFVTDWRQRNITFFSALEVERNVMFLILTLIVLVAALNIISGMTMLVKDKGHDIAILRTMGATRGAIMRVFVITGASIGVVGTVAGFILGFIVCLNVETIRQGISWLTRTEIFSPELYFLSRLPADMDTGETITVVVMALVLSLLATLYPAWRAARLDPVEALRYE